ncbi:hypothetical protein ACODNH_08830 [Haloarcula sp. NS06]|jgi:hypothetical protein|uniref:hypothetical protein n=1 Tax=Haloarcula TaxID=2237 RepID=UPI0027B18449|nr:hypothetical protein [Haloarcula sp. H-GB4]MDQ2073549.1 hypothetical protein [Haloarcula sp. H-GB4]
MEDEAWRSVDIIRDNDGVPHVLQQKMLVFTSGVSEESAGYTKPAMEHRLVPLKDLTKFGRS